MSPGVARSEVDNTHAHIGVKPSIVKKKYTYPICTHQVSKEKCRVCSAHLWCEHGNSRSNCPDCDNWEPKPKKKYKRIDCVHGTLKQCCKICSAYNFCVHDVCKYTCQKCGHAPKKKARCPHQKFSKGSCQICSPNNFCMHDHNKWRCRKCGNAAVKQYHCEHNRTASRCKECRGDAAKKPKLSGCEHNARKSKCQICRPDLFCSHNVLIFSCTTCKGGGICVHNMVRYKCEKCPRSGEALAKFNASRQAQKIKNSCIHCIEWPDAQLKNIKYGNFCARCFVHLFPDDERSLNARTKSKENKVKRKITLNFADYDFIHDKVMLTGSCCTHRRSIDHRCMISNTMLCIETDEFAHRSYDKDDEEHRYSDLFMANSCKYIFIRFNPDPNREARRAKTDFDAKLRSLMTMMRAQIKRIEEGANTELVEIHKLFCCKKCLENNSALCVCEGEI